MRSGDARALGLADHLSQAEGGLGRGSGKQSWRQTHNLHKPPAKREEQKSERECGDQEPTLHGHRTVNPAEIFPE
jgi:hypothetical protein